MIKLVVIGGGPAGISACVQAKRLGLDPLLIEKSSIGGSVCWARRVENFPPFSPIPGKELSAMFEKRHFDSGTGTLFDEVTKISRGENGSFVLLLKKGVSVRARSVILASGQKCHIPEELKIFEHLFTFHAGAWTDKNETVIVYGGGDVAVDQALLVRERGGAAELFCRNDLRAKKALVDEAKADGLKISEGFALSSVERRGGRLRAEFRDGSGGTVVRITDHILLATGKVPQHPEIEGCSFEKVMGSGFSEYGGSIIEGLFVAGDLRRGRNRNIAVALGDGIMCAEGACRYIKGVSDGSLGSD